MSKRRRDARRAERRKTRGGMGDMGGMSQKQMQKALANVDTEEIEDVTEVIVRTPTQEYVLKNPEVSIMKMGQEIWSVVPESVETRAPGSSETVDEEPIIEISDEELKPEDIQLIMGTANVSEEKAKDALKKAGGDLAKAMMSLN